MQKKIADEHIHDGHRSRMRSKLLCHGRRIFDTYELLEMLLYYTVPYKDTNPIAKRLLAAFGDLEGVFSASKEELVAVSGVGESTAGLIKTVDELSSIIGAEIIPYQNSIFADFNDAGGFFVDYYKGLTEKKVTAVYLDNNFNLISIEDVAEGVDYESAAIKPKIFIDGAIKHHASMVMTAHNHPYGSPFPSPGDRATHQMLDDTLSKIRVEVCAHYIVAGDKYISVGNSCKSTFCQNPMLDEFYKSKGDEDSLLSISEQTLSRLRNCYNSDDYDYFERLLSYSTKSLKEGIALAVLKRFQTIEGVLNASPDELKRYVGEAATIYIKLVAYLCSRRVTDGFSFGRKYTETEIAKYLKALYLGEWDENVYILCLDSKYRITACDLIASGTVNSTDVLPRKVLEFALRHSAKKIIISHNHPFGKAEASDDDLRTTSKLGDLLNSSGISFLAHYIVAGQKCAIINSFNVKTDVM